MMFRFNYCKLPKSLSAVKQLKAFIVKQQEVCLNYRVKQLRETLILNI